MTDKEHLEKRYIAAVKRLSSAQVEVSEAYHARVSAIKREEDAKTEREDARRDVELIGSNLLYELGKNDG